MNSQVEIYFDENGRPDGAHVYLLVNEQALTIEFTGSQVSMFALYPEDADTVHDDYTPVSRIILPDKEADDVAASDGD